MSGQRRIAHSCILLFLLLMLAVVVAVSACGQPKEARGQGVAPTTRAMSACGFGRCRSSGESCTGQLRWPTSGDVDRDLGPGQGILRGRLRWGVKGGAAATVADHSCIGSVTKTFTAVAVLQQVEAGKLALTDTVQKVLPDLATKYPESPSKWL